MPLIMACITECRRLEEHLKKFLLQQDRMFLEAAVVAAVAIVTKERIISAAVLEICYCSAILELFE